MEEVAACIENSRKYDLERGPCVRGDVATGGGAIPGRANLKSEDTGPIGLIAGPEAKLLGAGGMKKKIVLVLQTNEDDGVTKKRNADPNTCQCRVIRRLLCAPPYNRSSDSS